MTRARWVFTVTCMIVTLVTLPVANAAPAGGRLFPATLLLPDGFQPEGIAIAPDGDFYVGSIPTGAIYKGSVIDGLGSILVDGVGGRSAIGLALRKGKLFVAGGSTGQAYVYDASNGAEIAVLQLTNAPAFVNDVIVTRDAAWFTDSFNPVLYRVAVGRSGPTGAVATLPLTGDIQYQAGFNANGIEATSDGRTLIIVQSNTGKLFRVDARTGVAREIDLGGTSVANGDGILRFGPLLYVVRNRDNLLVTIRLANRLASGRVVAETNDPRFDVPTTVARFGPLLYLVNARFGTPPAPETTYTVERIFVPLGLGH